MKQILFSIVALVGSTGCFAQNGYGSSGIYDRTTNLPKDKHFFVIPPGSFWFKQSWKDSVYLFPEFQSGRLELTTGFTISHHPMLNYNVFLGLFEIQQENGDRLILDISKDVKFTWIGDHKFVYTPTFGYMEIIHDGRASVAELTTMHAIFEFSSGTKYPLSVADIRTGVSKTTRYYWEEKQYFIVDAKLRPHHGSPSLLYKLFPKQKSKIRSFIKNHKTDFRKKEDILDIVRYCNGEL